MEKIVLAAMMRKDFGKDECKRLRREGQIPGVVYKDGKKAISIQVDNKDLWHALHTEAGENVIITMDISDGRDKTEKTVIVKEIQRDPVNDRFVHVDFHEISLKEKLKVKVPIVVKGEAVGVREDDGVLTQEIWELEVECMPADIPEHVDIKVDELRIGDSIHIKDIAPPQGVTVLGDPDHVVVSVIPPKMEEEVVEEVPAEGAEEPEVIKRGKKEEEEEAPAEGEEAPPEEKG
jgi:large subunit ribosomal protein L25